MSLFGFDDLYQAADRLRTPVGMAVAGAADRTVLEAMRTACDRGWVAPILAGRAADIRRTADDCACSLNGFTIVDTEDLAAAAVAEVRGGRARMLMKGQVATPKLLEAVLDSEDGLRTGRVICQVVLMELASGRRFLLADTGICIKPSLEQQADILRSAADVARTLGTNRPRIAIMAATESVTAVMPETLDAAELQRRGQAGAFGPCDVQGPLSFDLAFADDAAQKKHIAGAVTGAADVLLFPNLLAANLTVKAIMYTANCRFGGVLCGAACPVVFMSRADTTATRLHSIALALQQLAISNDTNPGDELIQATPPSRVPFFPSAGDAPEATSERIQAIPPKRSSNTSAETPRAAGELPKCPHCGHSLTAKDVQSDRCWYCERSLTNPIEESEKRQVNPFLVVVFGILGALAGEAFYLVSRGTLGPSWTRSLCVGLGFAIGCLIARTLFGDRKPLL
jgi:phosphotransacetylase